jgi:hypothetical protein
VAIQSSGTVKMAVSELEKKALQQSNTAVATTPTRSSGSTMASTPGGSVLNPPATPTR